MFTAGKKSVLKYGGKQILKLKDGLPLLEPNKPNDSQEEREQAEGETHTQRWKNVQILQIYLCYFFFGCANFLAVHTQIS